MIFRHFRLDVPSLETNAFVIACEETRKALLIDVGIYEAQIAQFLAENGLSLDTILLTHYHWDHTDGLADAVAAHPDAKIYSRNDEVVGVSTTPLGQGDSLKVGTLEGHIVETPGHTEDGISLILDQTATCPGMVFSGDALFAGSVGGTSTPEDYETQLEGIRKNLFGLPGHYEVHVGHGSSSTIAVEREFNPFFV
jgi:hydroxyacylglutathione hydrolase